MAPLIEHGTFKSSAAPESASDNEMYHFSKIPTLYLLPGTFQMFMLHIYVS